jgi:hypothetical protein
MAILPEISLHLHPDRHFSERNTLLPAQTYFIAAALGVHSFHAAHVGSGVMRPAIATWQSERK